MGKTRYVTMLAITTVLVLGREPSHLLAESPEQLAVGAKVDGPKIQDGSTVKIEYTLTDEKGKVLDTSKGREPLSYVHGEGNIIPGLEKALSGLRAGDQKRVVVPPEEAYGRMKPVLEVPTEQIPPQARVVGAGLMVKNKNGPAIPVRVKEVKEKTVVLDANHPLAGISLTFDVKIVDVEPPPAK